MTESLPRDTFAEDARARLVTREEWARRAGVGKRAVDQWAHRKERYKGFPEEVVRGLYDWPDCQAFMTRHGLPGRTRQEHQ